MDAIPSKRIPLKIGRYHVIRELGRGGMGVVYLARDPFIDRMVAIKTTLGLSPADPEQFETFQRIFFHEARAAGKLQHPNIVSVFDATVEDDQCYLVMEYVDGASLKAHTHKGALLPLDKVLNIVFQCAKAVHYAHENGVIHRDIKPSNIVIAKSGEVKISDFGIATVEGPHTPQLYDSLTGSGFHISPEQIRNEPVTPATDIFALGVVMYELLTGAKPFLADTDVGTLYKIAQEDPTPLRVHRQDLPDSVDKIIMRALEKDPTKRFQSGLHFASELSAAFDHLHYTEEELSYLEKFNILKKIAFFEDFNNAELADVIKTARWAKYEADRTIIAEGEIEDCFYIILSGEVLVQKKGKSLAVLKRGDCFGEMAYLGHTKRTATISAISDTILMKLNASVIDQTSQGTQLRFYRVFAKTLIQRLARTSELVSKG